MPPFVSLATTPRLRRPTLEQRDAILRLPRSRDGHDAALARHSDLFDRLEVRAPPAPAPPAAEQVRVAFWNAERGKDPEQAAERLRGLGADVLLLCELDLGMARSRQRHVTRELAGKLGAGYAFGVEFLELGLGDRNEQAWHAGEDNAAGLHGAAILSPHALHRPALIRLEAGGGWFDGERGERRVGGRIAVAATLDLAGTPVTLASVHLESHSDPEGRAAQLGLLIEALERYAPGRATLIGGDLNTSTTSRDWARGTGEKPVLPAERVLDPVPFEPLFEVAAAAGFAWRRCNAPGVPTQRTRPDGTPPPPLGRIDWFLARGLACTAPAVVPAIDRAGRALSDHEILLVTVSPSPCPAAQHRASS